MVRNRNGSGSIPETEAPLEAIQGLVAEPFGISAYETAAALQTDAFKELINKLCWAIGSTYRQPYGSVHSPVRVYALRIAKRVLKEHGYPGKIALDPAGVKRGD